MRIWEVLRSPTWMMYRYRILQIKRSLWIQRMRLWIRWKKRMMITLCHLMCGYQPLSCKLNLSSLSKTEREVGSKQLKVTLECNLKSRLPSWTLRLWDLPVQEYSRPTNSSFTQMTWNLMSLAILLTTSTSTRGSFKSWRVKSLMMRRISSSSVTWIGLLMLRYTS